MFWVFEREQFNISRMIWIFHLKYSLSTQSLGQSISFLFMICPGFSNKIVTFSMHKMITCHYEIAVKIYLIREIEKIFQVFLFLFIQIGPSIDKVQMCPKLHNTFGRNIKVSDWVNSNNNDKVSHSAKRTIAKNSGKWKRKQNKWLFTLQCCVEMLRFHHVYWCWSPLLWLQREIHDESKNVILISLH